MLKAPVLRNLTDEETEEVNALWLDGVVKDFTGDVDFGVHAILDGSRLLATFTTGAQVGYLYDSESAAREAFDKIARGYDEWLSEVEPD